MQDAVRNYLPTPIPTIFQSSEYYSCTIRELHVQNYEYEYSPRPNDIDKATWAKYGYAVSNRLSNKVSLGRRWNAGYSCHKDSEECKVMPRCLLLGQSPAS